MDSFDFAVITEVEVEVVSNDADFAGETSGTAAIEDKVGKNTNDKKHPIIPIFDTKIIVMPILCYFWLKKKFLIVKFTKA